MTAPYSISVKSLSEAGPAEIPQEVLSNRHLVYSSPATLSYNSPGAQGFGVKRAGLVLPESVMLLVSPGCCGRNTTILGDTGGYSDRMFYLQMNETDLVTGRHLTVIPQAVRELYESCEKKPKVIEICITCVDALLGTDMERVCRKAEERCPAKVVPCYMYALTREGRNPPMVAIRQMLFSLLEKKKKQRTMVNLLGFFAPFEDDSDLYVFLKQLGIRTINELARCKTFDEYQTMGAANFNLVLYPESRKAANYMEEKLQIPYIELTRLYELDKIRKQYALFAAALDGKIDDTEYFEKARKKIADLQETCGTRSFAVGKVLNANPFELALALAGYGLHVAAVFSEPAESDYTYIDRLAAISPETLVFPPLSPTMMNFDEHTVTADITIGRDMPFYLPQVPNVSWSAEIQPFGYTGLMQLIDAIIKKLEESA
jgi:nitrogenase molybdenum-cofactor synthesis protein NifE